MGGEGNRLVSTLSFLLFIIVGGLFFYGCSSSSLVMQTQQDSASELGGGEDTVSGENAGGEGDSSDLDVVGSGSAESDGEDSAGLLVEQGGDASEQGGAVAEGVGASDTAVVSEEYTELLTLYEQLEGELITLSGEVRRESDSQKRKGASQLLGLAASTHNEALAFLEQHSYSESEASLTLVSSLFSDIKKTLDPTTAFREEAEDFIAKTEDLLLDISPLYIKKRQEGEDVARLVTMREDIDELLDEANDHLTDEEFSRAQQVSERAYDLASELFSLVKHD